jgi:hypothetical protein
MTDPLPAAPTSPSVVCSGGTYVRDAVGVWRYAWRDPVPGAQDLTVADVLQVWGDPLEVMEEFGREVSAEVREMLGAARNGTLRAVEPGATSGLLRRLGAVVCGLQAPELIGHAMLDANQLARRLRVTRDTIDTYRTRGSLPPPTMVRGRTPLWSAPVVRRWVVDRGR